MQRTRDTGAVFAYAATGARGIHTPYFQKNYYRAL